mmetsp:Transcript_8315/g.20954  ORF Transcript_8315/g.20954 Transcript_8315/m.20954 type:complete len:551 (-) Transcript_8315:220-1872(-)|eukprot:CAMPEP_0177638266 /NCGR_PEP_ID=MMETSP0447-20121125/5397_1 /TAXON_ID=0 /ORGANISM="Stygamoeba regulata, Strain BSH-02190019" /LENGTH=550 /DNA_ID=CAMNT_0019140217 /DNA_START=69 /DNA_END=1721 /DNA_ORIENTATION=+
MRRLKRVAFFLVAALVWIAILGAQLLAAVVRNQQDDGGDEIEKLLVGRKILQSSGENPPVDEVPDLPGLPDNNPNSVDSSAGLLCDTSQFEKYGGVFLEIIGLIYAFLALVIICDDFFLVSLSRIASSFHAPESIGALLMAMGSSAPELFTNVVAVASNESAIGTGIIFGTVLFKILVVIGCCAIFSIHPLKLRWSIVLRDTIAYSISAMLLLIFVFDTVLQVHELIIMMSCYLGYVALVLLSPWVMPPTIMAVALMQRKLKSYKESEVERDDESSSSDPENQPRRSDDTAGTDTVHTHEIEPSAADDSTLDSENMIVNQDIIDRQSVGQARMTPARATGADDLIAEGLKWEDEDSSLCDSCPSPVRVIYTLITILAWPLEMLFFFTVPRKWNWICFLLSFCWIGILSFLLVILAVRIGCVLGVTNTILGLTIIAAGISMPDCVSAILVARRGKGDMAISSSIGSNIFDILVALPAPWLIASFFNRDLQIGSGTGVFISALIIFSSVLLFVVMLFVTHGILTFRIGLVYIGAYICIIIYEVLAETLQVYN